VAKDLRLTSLLPLSLAVGIVAGGSVAYLSHAVPFGLQRGLSLPSASLLISLYSACGVAGSPVAGWLSDRLGPFWTLAAAALLISILWLSLPVVDGIWIFAIASLLGFFGAPINTMHAAALSALYDADTVGRAMGISYLIKLPFLFSLAPLVALTFHSFGSYVEAFALMAAISVVGSLLCVTAMLVARRAAARNPLLAEDPSPA
jgi:MFS family permease